MKIKTLKKLCCPFDKSDLTLRVITKDDQEENILEGILSCNECKRVYPIVSGIPIMNPDEFRDFKMEQPMIEKWEKIIESKGESVLPISDGEIKEVK